MTRPLFCSYPILTKLSLRSRTTRTHMYTPNKSPKILRILLIVQAVQSTASRETSIERLQTSSTLKLWPPLPGFVWTVPHPPPAWGVCLCVRDLCIQVCVCDGEFVCTSSRVWHLDHQLKPVPAAKNQWEQGADALLHKRRGNENQMQMQYMCV